MARTFNDLTPPADGREITWHANEDRLEVPDRPIIPFIEGDGTGPDIWRATRRALDGAVEKVYGGSRSIAWFEVLAGEKAYNRKGEWLPEDTLEAIRQYRVAIKGPLTTPVGGGIRSLNVTLRQILDLYACVRPVRYYKGIPSPVKEPQKVDMIIFRENIADLPGRGTSFPQLLLGFEKLHHRIRKRRPPLYHRSHLSRWKQRQISDTTCSPYPLWDRGIRRVEELSTDRLTGEHDPATRRKLSS